MFVIKNSRYKELQEDYSWAKESFQRDITEMITDHTSEVEKFKKELAKCQETSDMWEKFYFDLKASLPKPRERAYDGKFAKGSYRLDNLRKHLMAGNRTDKFTAQESFNIGDITKYIAKLKAEGFVVRKQKRRIAEDSFVTDYWIEARKEAREWKAVDHGLTHRLTVEFPTEEEGNAIFTEAKKLGIPVYEKSIEMKELPHIWFSPSSKVSRKTLAHDSDLQHTFVTAAEFIARMQPQQTNA